MREHLATAACQSFIPPNKMSGTTSNKTVLEYFKSLNTADKTSAMHHPVV